MLCPGVTRFELQLQMKLKLYYETHRLVLKISSGFSSQYVYQHLLRKKLFNFCFHFEDISIYLQPILKLWAICILLSIKHNLDFLITWYLYFHTIHRNKQEQFMLHNLVASRLELSSWLKRVVIFFYVYGSLHPCFFGPALTWNCFALKIVG